MGKRARREGRAPSRRAARLSKAERDLGIDMAGLSKPVLDAMNRATQELFGVGVGVCVQEEERETHMVRSLLDECEQLPRWALLRRRRLSRLAGQHRGFAEEWTRRIRTAATQAANFASDADLARAGRQQ